MSDTLRKLVRDTAKKYPNGAKGIGGGECWQLVERVLLDCKAKTHRDFTPPADKRYWPWGEIATQFKAGYILLLVNAVIKHAWANKSGTVSGVNTIDTRSVKGHVGIIVGTHNDLVTIVQQNMPVGKGVTWFQFLTTEIDGDYTLYEPVPKK
jgi:hypothetical protein